MISLSHWGMFELPMPPLMAPLGYKIDDPDWERLMRTPGAIIRMKRV